MIARLIKDAILSMPYGFTNMVPYECNDIINALLGIVHIRTRILDCFEPISEEKAGDHAGESNLVLGLNDILNVCMAIWAVKVILSVCSCRVCGVPDHPKDGMEVEDPKWYSLLFPQVKYCCNTLISCLLKKWMVICK